MLKQLLKWFFVKTPIKFADYFEDMFFSDRPRGGK